LEGCYAYRKSDTTSSIKLSPNHLYNILDRRGWNQITPRPNGIHARLFRPGNCLSDISLTSPVKSRNGINIPEKQRIL
jgi:hypothetical protein